MGIGRYTKKLFASTLEEMLRATPFEKVKVKDLCEKCGADRQTFYYHFRDKYDLAAWIFIQDYEASLKQSGGVYLEQHAADTLKAMLNKRAFYRRVFNDSSQNAVSHYCFDYFVNLGRDAYLSESNLETIDALTDYSIKSHAFACIGHTVQWLNGETSYTPEEFAHFQYLTMPEVLKRAYNIDI